jgi:hypothetical protein
MGRAAGPRRTIVTEVPWSEEAVETLRKKRRISPWLLWGSGCGLAVLVVGGILTVLGMREWNRAHDPEIVWPEVAAILPYDTRPEGWEAIGTSFDVIGFNHYMLRPPDEPLILVLQSMPSERGLQPFFDPASRQNRGFFGLNEIRAPELGTIEVQGRSVRCLRFLSWLPEEAHRQGANGASIRLDLSGEYGPPIMVQITAADERAQIEDADVARLLQPFQIWRGR